MILLASFLTACVPSYAKDYDDARSACGLEDGYHQPLPFGVSTSPTFYVTEACQTTLGEVIGLDWESFEATPRTFSNATTTTDFVLSGVLLLVLADFGTTDEVLPLLSASGAIHREAAAAKGDYLRESAVPAGMLWTAMLTHYIDETVRAEHPAGLADYDDGTVYITFSPDESESVRGTESPLTMATALIHEATHGVVSYHVECRDGLRRCDADGAGAWGASVELISLWLRTNEEQVHADELEFATKLSAWACSYILDTSAIEACNLDGVLGAGATP